MQSRNDNILGVIISLTRRYRQTFCQNHSSLAISNLTDHHYSLNHTFATIVLKIIFRNFFLVSNL